MLKYEEEIVNSGIPLTDTFGISWERPQYDWIRPLLNDIRNGVIKPESSYIDRMDLVRKYSFAIPNEEAIKTIGKYSPILEVGCGTGYWAYELIKAGANIVPTDPGMETLPSERYLFNTQHVPIGIFNGLEALEKYPNRTLLIVWPSYDSPWATEVIRSYRGDTFIYIGEWSGGCCANDSFWEEVESNWEEIESVRIPQWYGIRDCLFVLKRKDRGNVPS